MADVELKLSADASAAGKEIAGFRKQYADMVRTLQTPLRQIDSLRTTQEATKKTAAEFFAAKQRVSELRTAIASAGQPVKSFERDLNVAERTLARVTLQFNRQKESLRQQRDQLRAAGVDTRNLAAEQQRLQAAMAKAIGSGRNDRAVRSAIDDLGVGRARELQAELIRLNGQYLLLRNSGTLTARELSIAQRTYTQRIRETQIALRELKGQQAGMTGGALAGGIGVAAGASAIGYGLYRANAAVARQADEWVELTDRIKLASSSQEEYEAGVSKLREISDRTFTSMTNNAEIFITSLSPLRERGFSNGDALKFTEAIGLGLVSSAAKGEKAVAVINQLSNALQDGTLKGDAFTSIIRNTPTIADALTTSLGKTREELTAMASAGQLTTDVWVPALISQLDMLGSAVDKMNTLVSDAGVILENAFKEAVGKADVKPLVTAIKSLAETIRDPAVSEGITKISSLISNIGAIAVASAGDVLQIGKDIGIFFAKLGGATDELADIERQIEKTEGTLKGMGLGDILARQLYTEDEIRAEVDALKARRTMLVEQLTGMNAEAQSIAEKAVQDAEQRRSDELSAYRQYVASLKTLQGEQVKAAAEAAKKQVATEKAAAKEIEKVKQDRLKIEQRYAEAMAGFSGPAGNSFLIANTLKFNARQALNAGDVEGAQRQAQAALKMLQDLASAGENTMGFTGIANELRDIELAANDIEQSNAEQKLQSIKDEMAAMKAQAAELKDMPVSVAADQASIDAVRAQIEQLVAQLGNNEVVIPVRVAKPDGLDVKAESIEGHATGGYIQGPGTGTSDSILARLSNGEFVVRADAVRRYGTDYLHQLNSMRLPKFAEGGLVSNALSPSVPQLAGALEGQANGGLPMETLGRYEFVAGGETVPVYVERDDQKKMKILALKFGRSKN